jgi:hypothetical protein
MLEDPAAKVPNLESIIGVGLPSLFEKLACPSDGFIVRKPRNSLDAGYMAGSHEVATHGVSQALKTLRSRQRCGGPTTLDHDYSRSAVSKDADAPVTWQFLAKRLPQASARPQPLHQK